MSGPWGPWTDCSETCQSEKDRIPTTSRQRFCCNATFGGNCNGNSTLETDNCNEGVICPSKYHKLVPRVSFSL